MPKNKKIKPGGCDACGKRIKGPFIIFVCKVHCTCIGCARKMPGLMPDWTKTDGLCPYCKLEGAAFIEKTEFKPPFVEHCPKSLQHVKTIPLPGVPWIGWSTMFDDAIAIGRDEAVEIVTIDGRVTSHKLPVNGRVQTGLYLDTEKCLIYVNGPELVFTCNIDPRLTTPTEPQILHKLSVYFPNNIFPMPKFRYGILCRQPTRIEIFSKKSIYTENDITPLETLAIDQPKLVECDRACSTPDGYICISSYMEDTSINIYDDSGTIIKNIPGSDFFGSCRIEATGDGCIIATDSNGVVQSYNDRSGWGLYEIGKTRMASEEEVSHRVGKNYREKMYETWNKKGKGWQVLLKSVRGHACCCIISENRAWLVRQSRKLDSVDVYDITA